MLGSEEVDLSIILTHARCHGALAHPFKGSPDIRNPLAGTYLLFESITLHSDILSEDDTYYTLEGKMRERNREKYLGTDRASIAAKSFQGWKCRLFILPHAPPHCLEWQNLKIKNSVFTFSLGGTEDSNKSVWLTAGNLPLSAASHPAVCIKVHPI